MAKLSKKQTDELEGILSDISRANKYLKRDDIAGIAQETNHPNGASYKIVNPVCAEVQAVQVLNKNVGSDIVGIYDAKRSLENFIRMNKFKGGKQ